MKTAEQMKQVAQAAQPGAKLLDSIESVMNYHADRGHTSLRYVVSNDYNTADMDWAISELVAAGYKVDVSPIGEIEQQLIIADLLITWS